MEVFLPYTTVDELHGANKNERGIGLHTLLDLMADDHVKYSDAEFINVDGGVLVRW